jgi:hypothetical protein
MLKFLILLSCLLAIIFGAETKSESSSSSESTSSESTSSESTSSESTSGETSSSTTTTKAAAVKSNYFQSSFLGLLYVPYAINKCSATSPSTSIMPTCTDTTHVSLKTYASSDCSGTASLTQYNTSSPGTIFKCDGTNTYAEIVLGASGTCFATIYAALGTCTQYSTTSTVYYSAYTCSSATKGYLSLYTTSSCASPITAYSLNSTCEYEFTSGAYQVYGQILNCSSTTTTTTTTTTTAASTTSASTTSSTTSDANMVGLKNIFAIVMIAICIIAKL